MITMMNELMQYYSVNSSYVLQQFFRHLLISVYGVFFACIIAIPFGFFLARKKRFAPIAISLANILQTVPSLAMLSVLMIFLGLGPITVVVAAFLYSILPILKNSYTGILNIDRGIIDVAESMGMTQRQIIFKVELPLAMSIIIGGVRNAIVVAVAITVTGTFIGAGGMGDIISRGINVSDGSAIIWAGTIPTALMAIGTDFLLSLLERHFDVKTKE